MKEGTTVEQWRSVPGAEGCYEVSNLGRVRSLPHRVRLVAHGVETTRFSPGRILRPGPTRTGHLTVAIGRGNSRQVHSLVAEAFIGLRPAGREVAHLNGDPTDNRVENLAYVTRSENNLHVALHGRRPLKPTQVRQIRAAAARGFKFGERTELARRFGVSQTTVWAVVTGRSYAYV